jgi:hypothetical protein
MANAGIGRDHAAARDLTVKARGAEKLAAKKYGEPGHGMRITSPAAETEGRETALFVEPL